MSELQKKRDTARLEKKVGAWFRQQGRVISKALPKMRRHFSESVESDFDAMFDSAIKVTVRNGVEIFEAGLVPAVSQGYSALAEEVGMQDAFKLKQPEAVKWARTQAAKDVAAVNDTTKETIRGMVTRGLEQGASYDEVARQISKRFTEFAVGKPQAHIQSRAHLVAINENAIAYAHGESTLVSEIESAGIDMEKSWHTSGDDRVSKGCQQNAGSGWIPNDEAFPSGDMMYPRFPGCRCNVQFRVARSAGEREQDNAKIRQAIEDQRDGRITTVENAIRNDSVENGVVFDKNGKIIVERTGTESRIEWTQAETRRMNGATVTHNHPGPDVSFSPDDMKFMVDNNVRELRAVTSGHTYSLRMPDGGFSYGKGTIAQQRSEAKALIRNEASMLKARMKKDITAGKLTVADANASYCDELSKTVAKRLNLTYGVTPS